MCRRNCVYRGNDGCCNYSGAAWRTNSRHQTRHGEIAARLGLPPGHAKVRELLKGKNCPLYLWDGHGKPSRTRKPGEAAKPEEQEAPKRKHRAAEPRPYVPPVPEEALLREYREGRSDPDIGAALGMKSYQVALWRKAHGLQSNYRKKITACDEEKMMALYRQGMTDGKIGKAVGVNGQRVYHWRKARGLPPHVKARLTEEERQRRMERYLSGMTDRELAAAEGVRIGTIESWRAHHDLPVHPETTKRRTK